MKNFQVTDMPPGLFDVDDPIDDDHANSWPDETTKEGNNKIKTQKFYTVVKQSDIQKIVEKLKKKAEDQKLMDRNLIQLPEAESNETWNCSKYQLIFLQEQCKGWDWDLFQNQYYLFHWTYPGSWARNKVLKFLQWQSIGKDSILLYLGIDPNSIPYTDSMICFHKRSS